MKMKPPDSELEHASNTWCSRAESSQATPEKFPLVWPSALTIPKDLLEASVAASPAVKAPLLTVPPFTVSK